VVVVQEGVDHALRVDTVRLAVEAAQPVQGRDVDSLGLKKKRNVLSPLQP
jgi:hypothetical protein